MMRKYMVRVQKMIADAGICSRRKAQDLIAGGKVQVNGKIVLQAGVLVDPHKDVVNVGGKRIQQKKGLCIYITQ